MTLIRVTLTRYLGLYKMGCKVWWFTMKWLKSDSLTFLNFSLITQGIIRLKDTVPRQQYFLKSSFSSLHQSSLQYFTLEDCLESAIRRVVECRIVYCSPEKASARVICLPLSPPSHLYSGQHITSQLLTHHKIKGKWIKNKTHKNVYVSW